MKRLAFVLTICFCLVSVDCLAELTYEELQHVYKTSGESEASAMDNYVLGLYEGVNASNLAYYMQTKQFLYCKPNNFSLNVNNIRSIIKDAHDSYNTEGDIPVSYLLFVGLKKTFPCF
jgi:hypothetical protein